MEVRIFQKTKTNRRWPKEIFDDEEGKKKIYNITINDNAKKITRERKREVRITKTTIDLIWHEFPNTHIHYK